jgi:thiol-disulfide isomerase/thioredoxin
VGLYQQVTNMASRMSKKTWIILAIVIVVIAAVVGIVLSHNSSSPPDSTAQSQNATDFTLPAMTGANITLSELEGTPVVVNFWSIGCPACRQQLHYLEAVAQESAGEIEVIAINMADNAAGVQNFFGDYEPAMTVGLDETKEVFVNYCREYENPGYIPFTLFIDSEGVIQYKQVGAFASEEALWNTLHDVFGIATPQTS